MPEPKKPRAKRRNYEAELRELAMYCKLSVEILSGIDHMNVGDHMSSGDDHISGQIAALKAVLARLERQ